MSQALINIFLEQVQHTSLAVQKREFNEKKSVLKNLLAELRIQVRDNDFKLMTYAQIQLLCVGPEPKGKAKKYNSRLDEFDTYQDDVEWLASHWAISPTPPKLDYYHITLDDVAEIIGAEIVHAQNRDREGKPLTGKGVRVGIVDTGWYDHPYFDANELPEPYVSIIPKLPTVDYEYQGRKKILPEFKPTTDEKGHGTAMAANLLATAPKATIKMYKSSSFRKSLKAAVEESDIVSLSSSDKATTLERDLNFVSKHFDPIFQKAKERNVIIFMANGNGKDDTGGQPPGLLKYYRDKMIAVGGIYRDQNGEFEAADYALAHGKDYGKEDKKRYVKTPDICGLCGMKPHGRFIALPTYPNCKADRDFSKVDGTEPNDGWVIISGTSSATPQVAGVCALMKQLKPDLTQGQVQRMLKTAGRIVKKGKSFDNIAADGEWSRLVYAPRAIALVEELLDDKIEEDVSVSQSCFAIQTAAFGQPVMLNGMKVIFDEAVPVQPVNLVPKDKPSLKVRH